MSGYSEVFLTMASMVLFSLILMTANKIILLNSQTEVQSEAEKRAVAIAQSYINEASVLPFDEHTKTGPPSEIPGSFSTTGPDEDEDGRSNFDDFDDFHGWTRTLDWVGSSGSDAFKVRIEVLYVYLPGFKMSNGSASSPSSYKKMVVTVNSEYLTDSRGNKIHIKIPYLRRYYKRKRQ